MKGTSTHEVLIELAPGNDVQGVNWSGFNSRINRDYFRQRLDIASRNIFGELKDKPDYSQEQVKTKGTFATPERFMPVQDIQNHHFQLHHCLKVLSPELFIYPTKTHVELLNLARNSKTVLLQSSSINNIDQYKEILACANDKECVSLVNIRKPGVEMMNFQLTMEEHLINHIKFYHDRSEQLRLMIAGNSKSIFIFDPQSGEKSNQSIMVKDYVNHFSIDEKNQRLICAYDAKEVELYDMRSGAKIGDLIGHQDFTFGTDFHPDGFTVATANQDLTARIWDIRMFKETNKLIASNQNVSSVKFIQDGNYLAAGEYMSYLNVYKTINYKLSNEIDFFGQLVGIDYLPSLRDKLFVGISNIYQDVVGGIIQIKLGDSQFSK